jgi:hypothetical protein
MVTSQTSNPNIPFTLRLNPTRQWKEASQNPSLGYDMIETGVTYSNYFNTVLVDATIRTDALRQPRGNAEKNVFATLSIYQAEMELEAYEREIPSIASNDAAAARTIQSEKGYNIAAKAILNTTELYDALRQDGVLVRLNMAGSSAYDNYSNNLKSFKSGSPSEDEVFNRWIIYLKGALSSSTK